MKHAFRVAAGLDSMMLGETQILGQMKDAFGTAHKAGATGKLLNRLFQQTFAVAKQVRTDTSIGASAVSVASAAVTLARQIFTRLDEQTVLLIGAGDMIELCARHLREHRVKHMILANRTVERAQIVAREFGAEAISLGNCRRAWPTPTSSSPPLPARCRSSARARSTRPQGASAPHHVHGRHRRAARH